MDKQLNWKQHIKQLNIKISKSIGLPYKTRHLLPQKTLCALYNLLNLSWKRWNFQWPVHQNKHTLSLQNRAIFKWHFSFPLVSTNYKQKSIIHEGVKVWNSLHLRIKKLQISDPSQKAEKLPSRVESIYLRTSL